MNETSSNNKIEKTFFKSVRNYFRQYCQSTSIHGFRYFGEKRTIFERIWWFIIFIICLIFCVYSIYLVYNKWERSPVIVSFATRETPIYKIPFPTVTICPESKSNNINFNITKIFKLLNANESISKQDLIKYNYLSFLCSTPNNLSSKSDEYYEYEEFFDFINKIKPKFELIDCHFMGKPVNCNEIFTLIITDEGICYTFNMLDRKEIYHDNVVHYSNFHKTLTKISNWKLEHGYLEDATLDAYPRRALLAGAKNALIFNILMNKNENGFVCSNSLEGFRVLLHTAMRIPRLSQEYFRVPLNQAVLAAVRPSMITTSESVKSYHPLRRECYFPSERSLKFFRSYSQLNCMLECLTNYTLKTCDCVHFYMPRENGTEFCGAEFLECMEKAEIDVQMNVLKTLINDNNNNKNRTTKGKKSKFHFKSTSDLKVDCDCLPLCTDLTYNVETSQSNWDWDHPYFKGLIDSQEFNVTDYYLSGLKIFFKSNHFITSQRHELYGPTDFLANFGGLLGLFTGFSVLSLMEILYFLTVRIVCNIRLYGFWAGLDN